MPSDYQRIPEEPEKYKDVLVIARSSTSESSTLCEEEGRALPVKSRTNQKWLWLVHAILLSLSTTMFAMAYFKQVSTLEFVKKYSAYSPAAEAVDYHRVRFNDTMGVGSPYVGYGPEVDKAWRALSYDIGDQVITPEELKIIGMPTTSLKAMHPKTGKEGYRVGIEVFHQLHCLNLLRQVSHKEWYLEHGMGNWAKGEEDLRMHTDHCLEIIRMNLQCNADVGVFTFYMLEGDPLPWPELNSMHTCRNFDKVRDWALANSIGNMERPDVIAAAQN